MYEYQEKYNQHRSELQIAVKDRDLEGLSFQPNINPTS